MRLLKIFLFLWIAFAPSTFAESPWKDLATRKQAGLYSGTITNREGYVVKSIRNFDWFIQEPSSEKEVSFVTEKNTKETFSIPIQNSILVLKDPTGKVYRKILFLQTSDKIYDYDAVQNRLYEIKEQQRLENVHGFYFSYIDLPNLNILEHYKITKEEKREKDKEVKNYSAKEELEFYPEIEDPKEPLSKYHLESIYPIFTKKEKKLGMKKDEFFPNKIPDATTNYSAKYVYTYHKIDFLSNSKDSSKSRIDVYNKEDIVYKSVYFIKGDAILKEGKKSSSTYQLKTYKYVDLDTKKETILAIDSVDISIQPNQKLFTLEGL